MSKFKKGDWVREDDAEPGRKMREHGYRIYDVLPNDQYVLEMHENDFRVTSECFLSDWVAEPRCTGWDWVLPEPANRFGLNVGDTVTVKPHDARDGYVSTSRVIVAIDDSFSDGVARFTLDGRHRILWHPYYFGLCQSDGSPLPEKPATKTVVLEEWCYPDGLDRSYAFLWRNLGSPARDPWFKTGKTRELKVPNAD